MQSPGLFKPSTEATALDDVQIEAACCTPVKLYNSTSYGGTVLSLSARGTAITLSTYGFDNMTSSYKIGACSASFYDTSGLGTLYPGTTTAGTNATSMVSGWDNRVSSLIIL